MIKIDTHQHFWRYEPSEFAWVNNKMSVLKRDFLPGDVQVLMEETDYVGSVAIQAGQSESETEFLLALAEKNSFIQAVVGWVDLKANNLEDRLYYFSQKPKLKGFRHIVQDEKDPNFLLDEKFLRGISLLEKYNFTFDILIKPVQFKVAKEFVKLFPRQKFVLDHIGKPFIKDHILIPWADDIYEISEYKNLYCKLSGLVTECDWKKWKPADLKPFLTVVLESFGADRLMTGSDWPVCNLGAEYKKVMGIVEDYIAPMTKEEKGKILGENAIKFYNLKSN